MAKVVIENGCWIWQGSKNDKGYGRIRSGKKTFRAHRVSYEAFHGPIPKGHGVLHKCDNPSCINPDHLFSGTQFDNMSDASTKGRLLGMKGEDNPSCVLTKNEVLSIYNSPDKLKRGFVFRAAKKYVVNRGTIISILDGSRWSHITNHK